MKKTIFIMLTVLFGWTTIQAQEVPTAIPTKEASTKKEPLSKTLQFGLHAGSQGFGANAAWLFKEQFNLRLSGSYAPLGLTQTRSWGRTNYNMDMQARFGNIQAQLDFKPFKIDSTGKAGFLQKLAVSVGAGYFFKSEARAIVTPTNAYTYGEIAIQPSEIGTVTTRSDWSNFSPYAGLGLRNMKVSQRIGFNLDVGTYFLSSPKVSVDADKLLAANTSQQATLQNNLKDYRWLPVLQLGLAYQL